MSDNITFFCLVEGDSKEKIFKVIVRANDIVIDLRKKIKEKLYPLFEKIASKDIVLWKVNLPIEENVDVDIILNNIQDKLKLSNSTKIINEVFTKNITDNFINIIIERPSKCKKKRKAEEEFVITKPKKRKWEVNGAIQPNIVHAVYFVDPIEENRPLIKKIQEGNLVALHGPRASGKSTRVYQIQEQLKNDFICIYTSFEQVNFTKEIDFWKTFSMSLQRNVPELLDSPENPIIKSAQDFCNIFHRTKWSSFSENRVVLFVDEFDKLYEATDEVRSSCLGTLRSIKNMKQNFSIHSIVVIGPFNILCISTKKLTTSPFNVQEPFRNPNFTMKQVQFLYKQFADEFKLTIDQEVINDIYMQTNGHAGLVCLCGRAIDRKLIAVLENGTHLSFEIWERFTTFLLGNEILKYSTFIRMKDALIRNDTDTRRAVNLIRSDFLVNNDPIYVAENKKDLALFLTAEGILVPGEDAGTFKISSPLVHWLVLQRIIPQVFPTSPKVEVPYYPSTGTLDIFKALKQVICVFDQETIKSRNSFKSARVLVNNANNQKVPRESVYDTELYRIMSNWLGGFAVTGQWHLKYRSSGHVNNKYIDIVISQLNHPTIVFELLATATKKELKEHYERALLYDKKLPADETWVIHFTCEENAISEPCWPTNSKLQKGLRVVHIWHDLNFTKVSMIACWWNSDSNTRHITDVEEFVTEKPNQSVIPQRNVCIIKLTQRSKFTFTFA
ncbi:hypothetical protein Glove_123g146 [Diversispora epigaea]|uniref:Crinkler effector protein N-terminal domain-containing protein n=1 Tax=Diversispora epigaea TaxID=1348612 RepID=A0A397IYN8_9GLOM|nr:hypothetical protein Glove_123g146 [Diversispora epigaea]